MPLSLDGTPKPRIGLRWNGKLKGVKGYSKRDQHERKTSVERGPSTASEHPAV